MTTVYCVTGYPGAGKSEFAKVAQNNNIPVISMGDQVRSRYPDDSDEYEHTGEFSTEQRETHGRDIVARWTTDEIDSLDADTAVIEGVRSLEEMAYLEEYFSDFTLVYVYASKEIRLERLNERGREGEEEFDMDDLEERDEREEGWGLDELIEDGEYVTLTNEDSLKEFKEDAMDVLGVAC